MSTGVPKSILRKTLLDNGYVPLPAVGKAVYLKKWSSKEYIFDHAAIDRWETADKSNEGQGPSTGIRCDKLLAVDIDVTDAALGERFLQLVQEVFGEIAIARAGNPPKVLVLYRRKKGLGKKWRTGTWEDGNGKRHAVELLSGRGCQFVAYGIHPDTGNPYAWTERHPYIMPFKDLPVVDEEQIDNFKTLALNLFKSTGFTYVSSPNASLGDDFPKRFVLQSDTDIEVTAPADWARTWTVEELEQALAGADDGFTCRVSTGSASHHSDSGLCGLCGDGFLRIIDFVDNICMLRPAEERALDTKAEVAKLVDTKAAHYDDLVKNWVYAAAPNEFFHADYPERSYSDTGMKRRSRNWKWQGENMIDVWLRDDANIVEDLHFDPREPDSRILTIDGMRYLNLYNPTPWARVEPNLNALNLWDEYIEHLLPVEVERELFLDWLANKLQRPWQRMFGILMVATTFGTGRGTLTQILSRLFGRAYVTEVDFDKFMGKGSQGQFYDWLYGSLVVSIPEVFSGNLRWESRVASYERIKLMVDPGQQRRNLALKYARSVGAEIFASMLFATNHPDALAILENDRRLAVFENGLAMSEAMRVAFHGREGGGGWIDDDAALAALWRRLKDRAVTRDLFRAPLDTEAKARMVEAAKTDLDHAFEEFVRLTGAQAFTVGQFRRFCTELALATDHELPDNIDQVLSGGFLRSKGAMGDRASCRIVLGGRRQRFLVLRDALEAGLTTEEAKAQVVATEDKLGAQVGDLRALLKAQHG